jgi:hypothetical protein
MGGCLFDRVALLLRRAVRQVADSLAPVAKATGPRLRSVVPRIVVLSVDIDDGLLVHVSRA